MTAIDETVIVGLQEKLRLCEQGNEALSGVTSNWWKDLVTVTAPLGPENKATFFKDFEHRYKAAYYEGNLKHAMPGPYRSAKSVVLGALASGVPLVGEGGPVGKTEVQRAIRAARAGKRGVRTCPNCGHPL